MLVLSIEGAQIIGDAIILTKHRPSELLDSERTEAYLIALQSGALGTHSVVEQHGWWNECEQKAQFVATTFAPQTALSFEESRRIYFDQITKRFTEGFIHARLYSFKERRFVYHESGNDEERFSIRTRIEKLCRWAKRNS